MKSQWILAAAGLLMLLGAPLAHAGVVAAGTDYLTAGDRNFVCAWPFILPTPPCSTWTTYYYGSSIAPGPTNMTVERPADIAITPTLGALPTLTTGNANLMITGLSLQGVYQGNPVYLALDASPTGTQNLGYMEVAGDLTGGTFASEIDLFFDVCTAPSSTGVGCGAGSLITTGELDWVSSVNSASPWSPTPPPGSTIVDGAVGDQTANLHSGLSANQVDFFPSSVQECVASGEGSGCVAVNTAQIPEPGALWLLGPALLGLSCLARKRLIN
jgi:hypothetical protein